MKSSDPLTYSYLSAFPASYKCGHLIVICSFYYQFNLELLSIYIQLMIHRDIFTFFFLIILFLMHVIFAHEKVLLYFLLTFFV